jgi:hypothetical protein
MSIEEEAARDFKTALDSSDRILDAIEIKQEIFEEFEVENVDNVIIKSLAIKCSR